MRDRCVQFLIELHDKSSTMPSNYVDITLNDKELHYLHLHLIHYRPESENLARKLLAQKNREIHRILFPHFGLKQGLFGIPKKAPYKLDFIEVSEIRNKIHQINVELNRLRHEQKCFFDLYKRMEKAYEGYAEPEYPLVSE